jgi:hypothetical protein
MNKKNFRTVFVVLAAVAVLGFVFSSLATAQTQPVTQRPPEYNEVVAASRLQDLAAKVKELERIKAAFPSSQYLATIDGWILSAKVDLAPTLDAVLALQKDFLSKGKGADLVQGPFMSADQIVSHPKLLAFDKAKVLAAVLAYKEAVLKAMGNPDALQGIPAEQQGSFKTYFASGSDMLVARAQLNAGDAAKSLASLEAYRNGGGAADGAYSFTRAGALALQGKTKEAYEGYLAAAAENYEKSAEKAKELYAKLNGKADGFDAALQAKLKELPYHPEAFKAAADWKGKAVLAEIFTGSECPPCVGADLGFDGLIESIPTKYLAVLEYHLPIPAPDPMMNPAAKKRQAYYGVNSTPTVVIDGDNKTVGGGTRGMAGGKFMQYKAAIDPKTFEAPAVELKLSAAMSGDVVTAAFSSDITIPGTDYLLVLVQKEETYKGSNGLPFHKMVVRDLLTIDPDKAKTASFDLAASEKATDAYLTEFEKTYTRIPNFRFAQRRAVIARKGLRVVFFAQDRKSKKILNAVVADVR